MGLFSNVRQEIDEMFVDCAEFPRSFNIKAQVGDFMVLGNMDAKLEASDRLISAYDLLNTGLYSLTEICNQTKIEWSEANELLKRNPDAECPCGKKCKGHGKHCRHRIRRKYSAVFDQLLALRGQNIGNTMLIS